ncbi:MAG: hypothetical protein ACKN9V_08255 [Pseudomonadota bacterium]
MKLVSSQKILYFQTPTPLFAIAESLISLTPKVSVIEKDIYADISCTENLFGIVFNILQKAESVLETFNARCAWVLTEKVSWAKPLCLKEKNIFNPGESLPLLLSLPIESLALCGNPLELEKERKERETLISFLKKVGVIFCSDILKIPRSSLAHRFGQLGIKLVQSLEGDSDPLLPFFTPQEPLIFSIDTDNLFSLEALLLEIFEILPMLELRLQGRQAFIQKIKLTFYLENKSQQIQSVAFSKLTRDPVMIQQILKEALAKISWSSPLHQLKLEVIESVSQTPGQLDLWDKTEERLEELSGFVRRMRDRFGDNRVGFAKILSNYLPETSWQLIYPPVSESVIFPEHSRPIFLFEKPFPFYPCSSWKLTELERLNLHWWETNISRRYFLAEGDKGEKLWVFFDSQTRQWFCHGSYD